MYAFIDFLCDNARQYFMRAQEVWNWNWTMGISRKKRGNEKEEEEKEH